MQTPSTTSSRLRSFLPRRFIIRLRPAASIIDPVRLVRSNLTRKIRGQEQWSGADARRMARQTAQRLYRNS